MKQKKVKIIIKFCSIMIALFIVLQNMVLFTGCSAQEDLEKILVENYWECFIQSYEIYKFNSDGTGSIYGASPALYYDKEMLAYCIQNSGTTHIYEQYMPDLDVESGGVEFTYQLKEDSIEIYRSDFSDSFTVSYVQKSQNIDWDLGIYEFLPDNSGFFYETDFIDSMLPENAMYLVNTNIKTGNVHNEITVKLNGKNIIFDQKPLIVNGRTLVPLRAIFESMGANVVWDGKTQTVTSTLNDTTIELSINSDVLYKNKTEIKLDVSSQLINNYTMIPVRAVSEAFGAEVFWDSDTKTVYIDMK